MERAGNAARTLDRRQHDGPFRQRTRITVRHRDDVTRRASAGVAGRKLQHQSRHGRLTRSLRHGQPDCEYHLQWPTTDQKVWSLFYWSHMLKRQTPPITLHGFDVTDPIRNLVDYGYTMCSTTSGINQSLYQALGSNIILGHLQSHRLGGRVPDGKFHMIDTSMSNLVTMDDGVTLVSVPEVAADSARLLRERSLYSTSPNGFLTGTDTGRHLADVISPEDRSLAPGFAADFCSDGLSFATTTTTGTGATGMC